MSELINAKGLACPEPVILTKKALDLHDEVTVIVDNDTARENVKRLASSSGCAVDITEEAGGVFRMHLIKQQDKKAVGDTTPACICPENAPSSVHGPAVFVIASSIMGHGSDELGTVLMKAFIHTAIDLDHGPDIMIFYNTGVKLAASDSDVIDDLNPTSWSHPHFKAIFGLFRSVLAQINYSTLIISSSYSLVLPETQFVVPK